MKENNHMMTQQNAAMQQLLNEASSDAATVNAAKSTTDVSMPMQSSSEQQRHVDGNSTNVDVVSGNNNNNSDNNDDSEHQRLKHHAATYYKASPSAMLAITRFDANSTTIGEMKLFGGLANQRRSPLKAETEDDAMNGNDLHSEYAMVMKRVENADRQAANEGDSTKAGDEGTKRRELPFHQPSHRNGEQQRDADDGRFVKSGELKTENSAGEQVDDNKRIHSVVDNDSASDSALTPAIIMSAS